MGGKYHFVGREASEPLSGVTFFPGEVMEVLLGGVCRSHNSAWSQKEIPDVDLMALGLALTITGQCIWEIVQGQRLPCYRNRSPPKLA